MKLSLAPGRYIVAVSGGVDSVVLLDLLTKLPNLRLTVAHFDHGIRLESADDRRFVAGLAKDYSLPFVYAEGRLGKKASEAGARTARYHFLEKTRAAAGAEAVITAHHLDDALETAVINLLRGTGRRGLSSLGETASLKRPLLAYPKQEIKNYAVRNRLDWHEDPTNREERYLRNYVRRQILPRLNVAQRRQLVELIEQNRQLNRQLDAELINQLHLQSASQTLNRHYFIMLPHQASLEVMAAWLRAHGIISYDRKTLERLVVAAKTAKAGASFDINQNHRLEARQRQLALDSKER